MASKVQPVSYTHLDVYKRQVTLMQQDFLDKLVEHGNGQLVEVLILVNQSDKMV